MKHQVSGIEWLLERDTALLADEPGLGKSRMLLEAAVEPVLIVAPAMVLESGTWDDEIEKWAPGIDATQVAYSNTYEGAGGRVARGAFNVPSVFLKEPLRRRWGTVIADESHYLKGRKTSWTHALMQLRTGKFLQATGTPIPNWAHEAFMTLQFLFPEEAKAGGRLGSYWRWVNQWFEVMQSYYNAQAKEIGSLKPGLGRTTPNEEDWARFRAENWRDKLLLRLRDDCLDLPPLTIQEWDCRLTGDQKKIYTQLKRDFVAWLDNGTEVAAWSSGALMIKLLKISTGLESLDLSRFSNSLLKPTGKYAALTSLLEDRSQQQTIVVAQFRDSVAAARRWAERVTSHRVGLVHGGVPMGQRTKEIRAFQNGDTRVLCATIDTIREGMTLHQAGCDLIVRLEKSWVPSRNEQVIRRIHRIGQSKPVTVIDLIAFGTLDQRVQTFLNSKTDEQMKALGTGTLRGLVT